MREPINVVIYISGGLVTGVSTDLANVDGIRVAIVDYDNGREIAPEDMAEWGVHQLDDGRASIGMELPSSDPDTVADIMAKANA